MHQTYMSRCPKIDIIPKIETITYYLKSYKAVANALPQKYRVSYAVRIL